MKREFKIIAICHCARVCTCKVRSIVVDDELKGIVSLPAKEKK